MLPILNDPIESWDSIQDKHLQINWKRSKKIWGNCPPDYIIWVSSQCEEGAWGIEFMVMTFEGYIFCNYSECLSLYHS